VKSLFFNRRFKFGYTGMGGGGTPPIIVGDYIYYTYHPEAGFKTDNGVRKVVDFGNTLMREPKKG
jgi:hypothetical protein